MPLGVSLTPVDLSFNNWAYNLGLWGLGLLRWGTGLGLPINYTSGYIHYIHKAFMIYTLPEDDVTSHQPQLINKYIRTWVLKTTKRNVQYFP